MTWSIHQQQQQRGAQMPKSGAPGEATRDRSAQDHEKAGAQAMPDAGYPATRLEDRHGDITPTAPEAQVNWDEVVQPEARKAPADDLPLPEGK